jgi:integrase
MRVCSHSIHSVGPGVERPSIPYSHPKRLRPKALPLTTCFGSHRIRHATATLLVNNGMPLEEVSRYLGHPSTMPTRRYAQQTPEALGIRAADALARAGLVAG